MASHRSFSSVVILHRTNFLRCFVQQQHNNWACRRFTSQQSGDASNNACAGGGNDNPQTNKKGVIVDKSPVKILCEQGKTYSWCSCGLSLKQPLCDGAHKKSNCGLKPVRFTSPETKEYYFCNCKQTSKQPFCDGTHKHLK